MYLLKAAAAMLSVFAITYVTLSVLVVVFWRRAASAYPKVPAASYASFLYLLRSAPLGCALGLTVLFELPSFLRFEPKQAVETVGWAAVIAALFCIALALVMLVRVFRAWFRSEALLRHWAINATTVHEHELAIYEAREPAPLVAVSGLLSSRILVSASAREVLSERELRLAFAHEAAHARRHDNLRRFLLLLCWFPGMKGLEAAWSRAAEFAADDSAVRDRRDALDLAAALLKVAAGPAHPVVGNPLVARFEGSAGSTAERAERLIGWVPPAQASRRVPVLGMGAIVGMAGGIACLYPTLLHWLHVFTETLFR